MLEGIFFDGTGAVRYLFLAIITYITCVVVRIQRRNSVTFKIDKDNIRAIPEPA
jgi:hypothetical protein